MVERRSDTLRWSNLLGQWFAYIWTYTYRNMSRTYSRNFIGIAESKRNPSALRILNHFNQRRLAFTQLLHTNHIWNIGRRTQPSAYYLGWQMEKLQVRPAVAWFEKCLLWKKLKWGSKQRVMYKWRTRKRKYVLRSSYSIALFFENFCCC